MTIEQTVEIPASRRLTLEIPEEVPMGTAQVFIQFPSKKDAQTAGQMSTELVPPEAKGQISNEAFRRALSRAYGAWKDNPWTDHLEDINAMRDEWDHRDPWNPDPVKRHQG
ncbi:MAG: hypothetical protein LBQ93_04920 [Treponema sp.]|jgi:hypothetical protein|nr:hypothetical protein [Treponema sp.]